MEIVYSCGQFYWLVHNTWEVECCVITATTKTKQKSHPPKKIIIMINSNNNKINKQQQLEKLAFYSHDLIFLQCLLCGITGIKQLALIFKAKAE